MLKQFLTTFVYLCEKTFSSVTTIKMRYRSCLEIKTGVGLTVMSLAQKIRELQISYQNCEYLNEFQLFFKNKNNFKNFITIKQFLTIFVIIK